MSNSIIELRNESLKDNMELHQAIELVALLHFDGKLEAKSEFEENMHAAVVDQIKTSTEISQRTLVLCWVYLQVHAQNPLGQFVKVDFIMKE